VKKVRNKESKTKCRRDGKKRMMKKFNKKSTKKIIKYKKTHKNLKKTHKNFNIHQILPQFQNVR
jgi:hypothetical protein